MTLARTRLAGFLLLLAQTAWASVWVDCHGTAQGRPLHVHWLVGSGNDLVGPVDITWGKHAKYLSTSERGLSTPPLSGKKGRRSKVLGPGYFSRRGAVHAFLVDSKRDEPLLLLKAERDRGDLQLNGLFGKESLDAPVVCETES